VRRLKTLLTLVLAAILASFAPITHAIVKAKTEFSITLAAVAAHLGGWLFAPVNEATPATGPPEATPFLAQGEVFINKLLVLNSSVGLVQVNGVPTNYLGGFGYSPESYLKVTQTAPGVGAQYVEGIAVTSGVVHIIDASLGLPANIRWQHGLPLTPTGQLCVVFG